MRHLYQDTPGNASVGQQQLQDLRYLRKQRPLRVLSESDFAHWQRYGYVVVRQAISAQQVAQTCDFLWEFQQMSAQDPDSWYQGPEAQHAMQELNHSGMVEAYHHPLLWRNRQQPRIYDAFVDIWDREDLWVSIDRANLNPPNDHRRPFQGFIHWDANTQLRPLPVGVQGVLALTDTDEETGGFQCVPELFAHLEQWLAKQPADANPWRPEMSQVPYAVESVHLQAGDLLIFNSLLAHGIRPNRSNRVRMAQYIAMTPAEEDNQALRDWRIQAWREVLPPPGQPFPGDPRRWEQTRYPHAQLNALGRKLLGLDSWY